MTKEERILFTLTVYKDKTFEFRSHQGEIKGKWSVGQSLISAMLMLMMGVEETT